MSDTFSFRSLRKKEWRRSPQWETKQIIRILLILFSLYMIVCFVLIGAGGYFVLQKEQPNQSPILLVNQFLFYYLGLEWGVRFIAQQLPVTRIQQLMLLPIRKKKIVKNVLFRSLSSAYNSSLLFLFLPFALVLAIKEGMWINAFCWWLGVSFFILSIGNLNFLLNKSRVFIPVMAVFVGAFFMERMGFFSVALLLGSGMQWLFENPVGLIGPLLVFTASYLSTRQFLLRNFYLDGVVQNKQESRWGGDLKTLNRFGVRGALLKNDLRLLTRNVRVRQVLIGALAFLLYGLLFFPQKIYQDTAMEVFAALFTTGGFLMMFSQNIPAWDSSYFKLYLTQRVPLYDYLFSKWLLLVLSLAVATLLAVPYVFFGFRVYAIILAGSLFNAGLGTIIGLISGALNHSPIQLHVRAKAFENTQNFNLTQMLLTLPKLALPVLLFWLPYHYVGYTAGLLTLGVSGLLGLLFTRPLLQLCVRMYQQKKHEMIQGFYKND